MNVLSLILIAVGLAIDALAVSISAGLNLSSKEKLTGALKLGATFGFFQMLMPIIGWLAGVNIREYVASYDHWLAAGLLFGIGVKMIWEAIRHTDKPEKSRSLGPLTLLVLGIATSIDALAVGLSLSLLHTQLLLPIITIGTVTFVLSFTGAFIGHKAAHLLRSKVEILGGAILIGIGMKILLDHLI